MNFKTRLQKLFGLETKSGISSPDDWLFEQFAARPSTSGVSVTPLTAMTCPPVRRAVMLVSDSISQLPFHVHKKDSDGSKQRAPDHPVENLLNDAANPWTPPARLIAEVTRDAMLYPNGGFAFINRVDGRPVELIRLNPEEEPVTVEYIDREPTYSIPQKGGKPRIIPRENILHIPSPSLNGRGVVAEGKEAIGLALAMERCAARLFKNNAKPSGLISLKNNTTPEGILKARAAWLLAHGGENGGGTAVLPNDAEWQQITLSFVDSQFQQLRQFAIADIARIFGVPTTLLFDLDRATWANAEQMDQAFLSYSLMPWIRAWQDEIMLKLFTEEERKTYYVEFVVDGFARADLAARSAAYTASCGGPWMTPDEVRALENRPPIEGGDKLRPPANTSNVKVPTNSNDNSNGGLAA